MPSERGRPYLVKEHPLYDTWRGMRDRCTRPDNSHWHLYGGRGIRVYEPWCDSYRGARLFIDWATVNLGFRFPGWTLDRIDTNGHYVPGNLRWAPPLEQAFNGRHAIKATCDGKPMTLTRALVTAGATMSQASFIIYRIRKGDDLRTALTTNPHIDPSRITITSLPPPHPKRRV
jgi:hypothetical protein